MSWACQHVSHFELNMFQLSVDCIKLTVVHVVMQQHSTLFKSKCSPVLSSSCISSLLYWEKLLAAAPQIRRFNPYYPAQRNYCCPGTAESKEKTEWKPWHLYSQKQSSARETILLFLEQARIHQVFCILHSSGILMSTPSSKRRYPFTASCQCDVAPRRAQTIPQHHLILNCNPLHTTDPG